MIARHAGAGALYCDEKTVLRRRVSTVAHRPRASSRGGDVTVASSAVSIIRDWEPISRIPQSQAQGKTMKTKLAAAMIAAAFCTPALATPTLINYLSISGAAPDATNPQNCAVAGACTANENRLSLASDLYYDRFTNTYIGLADRGPGGGVVSYDTRFHEFSLNVAANGAISALNVLTSPVFHDSGTPFNGLNPLLLNGNKSVLGQSHDPEGVAVLPNGNLLVADEYGPAVREFTRSGALVRTFATPANLVPRQSNNTINYVDGRSNSGAAPAITSGRQDNRGYEGLTLSPDGTKAYAVMQDPLVNEGSDGDGSVLDGEGRRSRNVRIVEFDVATGQPGRQFIYQLDSIADINAGLPSDLFAATQQGRNIGMSGIVALNDNEFLVIERDNRGVGVDPASLLPVGSKRIYKIDISGASDVSAISLNNTNTLPLVVVPVTKSLYLDLAAALQAAGLVIPEKLEGIAIGPRLFNGSYLLLFGTDNDFSVTQSGAGEQFDVCTNGNDTTTPTVYSLDNPLGSGCAIGQSLVPTYLYAFSADFAADGIIYRQRLPLPASLGLFGIGAFVLYRAKRRKAS